MKKVALVMFVALVLAAGSASAAGGQKSGSWWFSIDNQLGYSNQKISPDESGAEDIESESFNIGFRPVYFFMDGLGVEANIAYMSSDTKDDFQAVQYETDYGIGIIYAMEAAGGYPFVGFGWNWGEIENLAPETVNLSFGEIKAGYIFEVKDHFGLGGELFYDFGSGSAGDDDFDVTRYGARISITGLVY